MNKFKADGNLLIITLFWGLTFPLVSKIITETTSLWFVGLRFALAALFLLPFVWSKLKLTNRSILIAGLVLGFVNMGNLVLQTQGLKTVDAPIAAFIAGTYVVFVPYFLPLLKCGRARKIDILSSLVCLLGLYELTHLSWQHWSMGEFIILLSAAINAFGIVYLQKISLAMKSLALLAFYQIAFVVPFALIFAWIDKPQLPHLSYSLWGVLLYCSFFATTIAVVVQTKFQHYTNATHAAIIYALEPVFACIYSWLIDNQALPDSLFFGGGLILASIFIAEIGSLPFIPARLRGWLNWLL